MKWIALGLALVFVVIQFIHRPSTVSPPVASGREFLTSNTPPPVAMLLRGACYDCHSYETVWPWYSHVAPVSWWIVGHINGARRHLNFSDWPVDNPQKARKKLGQISETIGDGDMPLRSYTWMHPAARLSAADKKLLTDWADAEADKIPLPAK